MSYQLPAVASKQHAVSSIRNSDFAERVQRLLTIDNPKTQRLWDYYRNPMSAGAMPISDSNSDRPYRQAQEWGLPARITGSTANAATMTSMDGVARKEVVVENDIAWRIDAMIDFLFGKPVVITSAASDADRRATIERLLRQIFACNGEIVFLQQLALIGAVYGFVDVLVKFDTQAAQNISASASDDLLNPEEILPRLTTQDEPTVDGPSERTKDSAPKSAPPTAESASNAADSKPTPQIADPLHAELMRLARCIRLEIVEPTRALPLLDPNNYRNVVAYAQVYSMPATQHSRAARRSQTSWLQKIFPRLNNGMRGIASFSNSSADESMTVAEVLTADTWQRYEDESLTASGANSLGELPLVHIQNSAVPFEYAGGSEVEALMPMQDELNTRLSDRAHRITMQSFKMYLGKGIDNFGDLPVAPGRMWMTENENAQVQEFGGDAASPSEDNHIREIRESMDKTSTVTPIAAGAVKGRIGNLTSGAALRVTMAALISKTERKQTLYGNGIKRMCELSLAWLDRAGLFHTTEDERRVELTWPSPLPTDASDRLADAEAKLRLGVPREVVLGELGYSAS